MTNSEASTTTPMPHVTKHPIDIYAFNSMAVMGLIAALHAGNQQIFIFEDEVETIFGSSPYQALKNMGWTFIVIPKLDQLKQF